MKKFIAITLLLAMCLNLSACGAIKEKKTYQEAEALMENKNWEGAIALYESIPEYDDAADKAIECHYQLAMRAYDAKAYEKAAGIFDALGDYKDAADYTEKSHHQMGMMENADYTFLAAMTERINYRNRNYEVVFGTYEFFVEEREAIEKFEDEVFFDERLGELARMYIEGVRIYESHLSVSDNSKKQARVLEGLYMMDSALVELYYDYGLMNDSPVYKKMDLAEQEGFLKMYDGAIAITEDIRIQFEAVDLKELADETEENGELRLSITNNTQYNYSAWIAFDALNANDIILEQTLFYDIEELAPGESQEFIIPMDEPEYFFSFEYELYINDVDGYPVP